MGKSNPKDKSFDISKRLVWEAYKSVKANKGAAGVDGQSVGRSVVQAVHGTGGVGKTQIAAEYAWRFAHCYDAVWWIHAEQTELIGEQLAAFATAWGLVDSATQVGPAVEALRRHCRGRGGWLVVLDNATSAHDVHDWLVAGPGHILVTTRNPQNWPEIGAAVAVDVFTREESVTLLHAHLPTLGRRHADLLAEAAGDLPLALAQAAGVLAETGMPAREYLDLLDTTPAEVLDEGAPISYPRSLAKAVRIAVGRLDSADKAAAQLLRLCAFLAPEPVCVRWFTAAGTDVLPEPLSSTAAAPLEYRRTVALLGRYGLAKVADDHITLHRLTQRLLRADAPRTHHEECRNEVNLPATAVRLLHAVAPTDTWNDPSTWPTWHTLLPHVLALVDPTPANATDPVSAALLDRAASYLHTIGQAPSARPLFEQAFRRHEDIYGLDHPATLFVAGNYAASLRSVGRHREARELNEETYRKYRSVAGDDHPDTLTSASNLAADLRRARQYTEALRLVSRNSDALTCRCWRRAS